MFIPIGKNPTFLGLQKQIKQMRKYFGTEKRKYYEYDFDALVYKKALQAANQVVQHYYESGAVSSKDKIKVSIAEKR